MWSHIIHLPEVKDTEIIAQKIAPLLKKSDILALFGDLGAGKTTFSRSILQSFGFDNVPSPTFTLLQTYPVSSTMFYHFDLYRLHEPQEVWELGVEEAFYMGVCLIEWPERLGSLLPEKALHCSFEHTVNGQGRNLKFSGNEDWKKRLEEFVK